MFKPNREFQAGLDPEQARRQREKKSLSLRRKDREKKLQNKRAKILKSTKPNQQNENKNSSNTNSNNKAMEEDRLRMLQNLPKYVQGCFADHSATTFECTQQIRKLLSFQSGVPIKQVIDSGVVPRLIQFLRFNQYPELQFESMWVLTNIASSETVEFTAKIVRDGAIPPFIDMLRSNNYSLIEQAIWALGNIAGDGVELRNMLLENGVLQPMLRICKFEYDSRYKLPKHGGDCDDFKDAQSQFISLLKNVSWAVSNFCRKNQHKKQHLALLLQCIYNLLQQHMVLECDDEETPHNDSFGANIGWALTYLLAKVDDSDSIEMLDVMNQTGITKSLIHLLASKNTATFHSSLRAIGNMVTANDLYTEKCIEYGLLPYLYVWANRLWKENMNGNKLKEVCWVLSNITAGTTKQVVAVIKSNVFPVIIQILHQSRANIANEALWVIANAVSSADEEIIGYLVSQGLIRAICQYLKRRFFPYGKQLEKILIVSLECLDKLLFLQDQQRSVHESIAVKFEEYGGLQFLEELQSDDKISERVYHIVIDIIKRLGVDDENEVIESNHNNGFEEFDISTNVNKDNQFGFGLSHNQNQSQQQQQISSNQFTF